jgi:signal transduction histidine kinase
MQMQQVQMKVVLESQESERKRFARDLHDGFGQLITAVKIMLSQMHSSSSEQERSEIALKSNEVLDSMHAQLREIAHNLMPEQLMEEGLEAALRDYARRITKNTDIQIEVNTFGLNKTLNQAVEINLYRIIQEWINNVIKYSGAKNMSLQLTGFDNEINLLIEDNGQGFDKEKLLKSSGWGWKNIQSRLEAINGKLEIDSKEGSRGTSFILDFPVA